MKDFDHLRGMVGDAMDNSAEVRRLTDHQFTLLRSDLSQLAEVEKKNRGTVREDIREELNVRLKSIHEELQTSLLDSFKKSEQQRRELVRDVDEELNSLMNRVGDIEKKENRTAEDVSKLRSGLNDLRDDVGDSFTHIQVGETTYPMSLISFFCFCTFLNMYCLAYFSVRLFVQYFFLCCLHLTNIEFLANVCSYFYFISVSSELDG